MEVVASTECLKTLFSSWFEAKSVRLVFHFRAVALCSFRKKLVLFRIALLKDESST